MPPFRLLTPNLDKMNNSTSCPTPYLSTWPKQKSLHPSSSPLQKLKTPVHIYKYKGRGNIHRVATQIDRLLCPLKLLYRKITALLMSQATQKWIHQIIMRILTNHPLS